MTLYVDKASPGKRRYGKRIDRHVLHIKEQGASFQVDVRLMKSSYETQFCLVFEHPDFDDIRICADTFDAAVKALRQKLVDATSISWQEYLQITFDWEYPRASDEPEDDEEEEYRSGRFPSEYVLGFDWQVQSYFFGSRADGSKVHRIGNHPFIRDGWPKNEIGSTRLLSSFKNATHNIVYLPATPELLANVRYFIDALKKLLDTMAESMHPDKVVETLSAAKSLTALPPHVATPVKKAKAKRRATKVSAKRR